MTYKNSLLVFTTIIILLSFVYTVNTTKEDRFLSDLQTLVFQAEKLNKAADAYKFNTYSLESLRRDIAETRLQYKEIEFLIDYYYPSFTEEHLNGAPLLHVEHANDFPLVMFPEGLQVLDESIYEDDIDKSQIAILAKKLESSCVQLLKGNKGKQVTNKELIEAMKFQISRISTLGITGFDTPGSSNVIEEALASIKGMSVYFDSYFGEMKGAEQTKELFLESQNYLANKELNFENFNRLEFIREFLNPLYSSLNGYYVSSQHVTSSVNQLANTPYDADFLDPYFFTLLTKKEDSEQLRKLGKKLFNDSQLSENGVMNCGSCHASDKAFTDGIKKSESNIKDQTVTRNSPTLLNSVYSDRYFYDLRAFNLEQQVEHVIFNSKEFNTAYESILEKLNKDKDYKKEFKEVFKTKNVSRIEFSKALSSYVLSLQSFDSEFDKYMRKEINTIDERIIEGFNLFMGKAACGTCHFPPTYAGLAPPYYNKNESEILGVLETPMSFNKKIDADSGRINNGLPGENVWIYEKSFKTSTVRNVEFSAPFFHNGAYPTLESVLDFYNHGGGAGIGLNVKNQTLSSDSLLLDDSEKRNIILFLNSLSDTNS